MTDRIVVFTTCGSAEEAERIAQTLVGQRLAACVSITPVRSIYRWKGEVESASEWQLVIKTRRELFERLAAALRQAHSYEVPEVIALPMVDGYAPYLDWVGKETGEEE